MRSSVVLVLEGSGELASEPPSSFCFLSEQGRDSIFQMPKGPDLLLAEEGSFALQSESCLNANFSVYETVLCRCLCGVLSIVIRT